MAAVGTWLWARQTSHNSCLTIRVGFFGAKPCKLGITNLIRRTAFLHTGSYEQVVFLPDNTDRTIPQAPELREGVGNCLSCCAAPPPPGASTGGRGCPNARSRSDRNIWWVARRQSTRVTAWPVRNSPHVSSRYASMSTRRPAKIVYQVLRRKAFRACRALTSASSSRWARSWIAGVRGACGFHIAGDASKCNADQR